MVRWGAIDNSLVLVERVSGPVLERHCKLVVSREETLVLAPITGGVDAMTNKLRERSISTVISLQFGTKKRVEKVRNTRLSF